MKIGLTGGTGFIGQYLIALYGSTYEFVVPTSKKDTKEFAKPARYVYSDYSLNDYEDAFLDCEAVIHLGGKVMKGYDDCLDVNSYGMNMDICEKVFRACKNLNIKNVVYASSVAVYDQNNKNPVSETAACQPNSMYGVMKIAAENIAEMYNRRYGMNIKILRIAQVLGLRKKLDESWFWDKLLMDCVRGNHVCLYGSGVTGRDVIYVKDVARSLICGINNYECKGVFNIGTNHICTNLEIAEAYCKAFENSKGIIFDESKQETGIRTCLDCKKAEAELGFRSQYDIYTMVCDIKKEYLASGI